ncbi:MAG TPA: RNA pyrophosphohydrolase [Alphaproteobacteria bacterium]
MSPAGAEERPYRSGVGIMLVNARNLVFVGRRADTPGEAWQMPQGGIDDGETPRAAALRELQEEVGTDKSEIIAESRDWFAYDLPPAVRDKAWGGRFRGQKQKWFLCRFLGTDDDIDLDRHGHPEFIAWRWIEPAMLPRSIVAFKCHLYEAVLREFGSYLR